MEGTGNITWADGSTYHGVFTNNKLNGAGTYIDSQGNRLVGTWVNNIINGNATIMNINTGIRLEGELVNSVL